MDYLEYIKNNNYDSPIDSQHQNRNRSKYNPHILLLYCWYIHSFVLFLIFWFPQLLFCISFISFLLTLFLFIFSFLLSFCLFLSLLFLLSPLFSFLFLPLFSLFPSSRDDHAFIPYGANGRRAEGVQQQH